MFEIRKDTIDYSKDYEKWREISLYTRHHGFNSAYAIGSASYFFKTKEIDEKLNTFEDFTNYYFKSGEESKEMRDLNYDKYFDGHYKIKKGFDNKEIFKMYGHYGRTLDEIKEMAIKLYNAIQEDESGKYLNAKRATVKEVYQSFIRLIFLHSWNGIKCTEKNTRNTLEKYFSEGGKFTFEELNNDEDIYYSVDLVVKDKNGNVVLGLQVKPENYLNNSYIQQFDLEKQEKFKKDYNTKYDVLYIYASKTGFLVKQSYRELKTILGGL